jgi:catechol 2,3-dioxygenase-like lactoylglutathione lyase family enzyme
MNPTISVITLGVSDLDRSCRFYKDGLGLPEYEFSTGIRFFKLQGAWLALYPREGVAKDACVADDGRGFDGVTLAQFVDNEDDVHTVIMEAEKAGARITKSPQKTDWGGYHAYFADPDGHLWEIAWNPHFRTDA